MNSDERWGINEQGTTLHYFPTRDEHYRPPGTKPQASCGLAWSDTDPPKMVDGLPRCKSCLHRHPI